jgi:hypothetical protein
MPDHLKRCRDCQKEKPHAEYRRKDGPRDGLSSLCRPCESIRRRAYYIADRARVLARARTRANVPEVRKARRKYLETRGDEFAIRANAYYRRWYAARAAKTGKSYNPFNGRSREGAKKRRYAVRTANNAIAQGRLIRPDHCSECGNRPLRKVEGHHPDYSKPLEVEWLCRRCHAARHRAQRSQKAS